MSLITIVTASSEKSSNPQQVMAKVSEKPSTTQQGMSIGWATEDDFIRDFSHVRICPVIRGPVLGIRYTSHSVYTGIYYTERAKEFDVDSKEIATKQPNNQPSEKNI